MIRRSVPNDNSCLFYALAYCCEGAEASRSVEQRLRKVVADAVLADPDPDTRAVFLGKPVREYADWILNTHHWGGEYEIVLLAEYYKVEICLVSCESISTIVYGEGSPAAAGRVYVLYTGQQPSFGISEKITSLPPVLFTTPLQNKTTKKTTTECQKVFWPPQASRDHF